MPILGIWLFYDFANIAFLAVQDSSISDIVCLSLGLSEPANNQSLQSVQSQ